jgi:predicted secreted protein
MTARLDALTDRLRDERGRRVAFVAHCLLNQNTRYLGGAFRPAGLTDLVSDLLDQGIGICQLPCPEQHAWGGVLKRRMLLAYGARTTPIYTVRRLLLPLFLAHTRLVYWRLARQVAAQIADYQRSGITVVAIIGVGASPSCGVHTTLDIRRSFAAMAALPTHHVDRVTVNRDVVTACRRPGSGLFTHALQRQLHHRHLDVPFLEHDLIAEMHGQPQHLLSQPLAPASEDHSLGCHPPRHA